MSLVSSTAQYTNPMEIRPASPRDNQIISIQGGENRSIFGCVECSDQRQSARWWVSGAPTKRVSELRGQPAHAAPGPALVPGPGPVRPRPLDPGPHRGTAEGRVHPVRRGSPAVPRLGISSVVASLAAEKNNSKGMLGDTKRAQLPSL